MKILTTVKKENKEFSILIDAVIESLGGTDYVKDVINHGMAAGFPGFTYYSDTHEFAIKNQKQIVALLDNMADQLGEEVVSMVNNFGVFKGKMDNDEKRDLYAYLSGNKPEQGAVTNVMAWFAAEEVCRMFDN